MMAVAMGAVVQWDGRGECGLRSEGEGQCVVSIDLVLGEMAPAAVEEEIEREGRRGHGNEWQRSPRMLVPSSIAHYRHGKRDQGAPAVGRARCDARLQRLRQLQATTSAPLTNGLTRISVTSIPSTISRQRHSSGEQLL